MEAIHAQRLRDATGPLARGGVWVATLADVTVNGARAHLDILRQDVAFSARTLRRAPGFAATVVTVAALGVGASTAAVSITDHVLLRPLPFKEPDRLVKLWEKTGDNGRNEVSPANYRDWKRMSRSFEAMGALYASALNLGGDG